MASSGRLSSGFTRPRIPASLNSGMKYSLKVRAMPWFSTSVAGLFRGLGHMDVNTDAPFSPVGYPSRLGCSRLYASQWVGILSKARSSVVMGIQPFSPAHSTVEELGLTAATAMGG